MSLDSKTTQYTSIILHIPFFNITCIRYTLCEDCRVMDVMYKDWTYFPIQDAHPELGCA